MLGFIMDWKKLINNLASKKFKCYTTDSFCHVVGLYVDKTVHTDKIHDMLRDRTYVFVLIVFSDKLRRPWD